MHVGASWTTHRPPVTGAQPGTAVLLAAAAALLLPAVAGAAPTVTKADWSKRVRQGESGHVAVRVSAATRCTLTTAGGTAAVRIRSAGRVRFTFDVHPHARPGRHTLRVRCGRARPVPFRVRVVGRRRAVLDAAPPAVAPRSPEAPAWERALHTAATRFASRRDAFTATFRNGQCTDWAQRRRPELPERVEIHVDAAAILGAPRRTLSWSAHLWDDNARLAGVPVEATPSPGAIMVFEPGAAGATWSGHVAYVEAVNADGSFRISEMNTVGLGQVAERVVPAGANLGGVSFVPRH